MSASFKNIALELTDGISTALGASLFPVTYSHWFLPDRDNLNLMYENLHLFALGNFNISQPYWSSSELNTFNVYLQSFDTGVISGDSKTPTINARACRSFVSSEIYSLRDVGPAGGYIFNIINNLDRTFTYFESAPTDQSNHTTWSNMTLAAVGGTSVGMGAENTLKIITQTGHITSAAKLCNDLEIVNSTIPVSDGYISVNGVEYPVYVTMPKIAPDNYVYIGGIIQTEDGTKDEFIYTGTVQIRVTTDNRHTAEKKLAQEILDAVRQILKPTKESVFTMTNFTVVVFKQESYTELVGQSEGGLRIDLIDIYNFIIT